MATEWSNWSGSFQGPVAQVVEPPDLPTLIETVRDVTKLGSFVHAEGSAWAFSAPAYCRGTIVDTVKLTGFPAALQQAINGIEVPEPMLVAVEGGIKIRSLNDALYGRPRFDGGPACAAVTDYNYCLPSLGGAGGQSIAGAVSTGTHGGDVRRGPLSDAVRAMVMVGTGGEVRLLQPKAVPPVVDIDRLTAGLREQYEVDIPVLDLTGDDRFQAAVVSVGRFGVVWAYVLQVVDETNVAIVEQRKKTRWSEVRRTLIADAAAAAAEDGYLGLVLNPHQDRAHDNTAYLTRHRIVDPGDPTSAALDPQLKWVVDARRDATVQAVMQALCRDQVTPELQGLAVALVLAGQAIIDAGGIVAGPLGALVAAEVAARPLFAGAESIGRIGADHLIGDAVADVLNLLSGSGFPEFVSDLLGALLDSQEAPTLQDGVTPWEVKGTRFEIANVFDLDHDCYRGDSVELFFNADDTFPNIVDELLAVFTSMAATGTVVGAAYFSIRFMAPGQALLSLPRWPMSASVEVAMLRGLFGNFNAMRAMEQVAITHGGTVHWGQQNDLSRAQVETTFGAALTGWRGALAEVEGDSTVFSTPFTHTHGLEAPAGGWDAWVDLGVVTQSDPAVANGVAGDPLCVFIRDDDNIVAMRTRQLAAADSDWTTVVNDPVDGPPVAIRGHSGRIEVFVRSAERIKHTWQQDHPGGEFVNYNTLGRGDYSQVHDDNGEPAPVKHIDGRLEMFARGNLRYGMPLMHTWAHLLDSEWTDLAPRGRESIISRPSAALRQVVGEQIVVVAMDEHGALIEKHQTGPGADSGWTSWARLVPTDPAAAIAAPPGALSEPLIVPNPAGVPGSVRVLVVNDRGRAFETVETGASLDLTWSDWTELPESPQRLDNNTRMAFVVGGATLALFTKSRRGEVFTVELGAVGWGAWQSIGGDAVGELAAGTHEDGTLEVVARAGGLGHLMARRQVGGRW